MHHTTVASASARTPITLPATPDQSDLAALHIQACNALAQALHTLRASDCTAQDLHRAIGRAMRATTAMKRMAGEVSQ